LYVGDEFKTKLPDDEKQPWTTGVFATGEDDGFSTPMATDVGFCAVPMAAKHAAKAATAMTFIVAA